LVGYQRGACVKQIKKNAPKRWRVLVGLTGALGSGKSVAAEYFRHLGAKVIDADKVCHQALKEKAVVKRIAHFFGKNILRGNAVDRKKLGQIVFKNRQLRKILEKVIHGLVIKKIKKIASISKKKIVIVDAPLLIEAGFDNEMDAVIVVKASKKKCMERGMGAGFDQSDIVRRMAAQLPLRKKLEHADFVINNNGTKAETRKQVLNIWKTLA